MSCYVTWRPLLGKGNQICGAIPEICDRKQMDSNSVSVAYKTTSQDRKRKHLPYVPEEIFKYIMSYRSKLTRRQQLLPRYCACIANLYLAENDLADLEDEDPDVHTLAEDINSDFDDDDSERDELIEYIRDLRFKLRLMRNRIKQIDTDRTFWEQPPQIQVA